MEKVINKIIGVLTDKPTIKFLMPSLFKRCLTIPNMNIEGTITL